MKKLLIVVLALAGFLATAASAAAQEAPPAPVEPVIAQGVTISGVAVGGLTREQARAAVQAAFDEPIRFTFKKRKWRATPSQLGATPRLKAALGRAFAAAPDSPIPLIAKIRGKQVRKYVAYLRSVFERPVRNTRVRVVKAKPRYTKARNGVVVNSTDMIKAIVATLREHERGPIPLEATLIEPAVTAKTFGPVVVIRRETKQLHYYRGKKLVRKFGVATGLPQYPTPVGSFSIVDKQANPTWYPPDSDWAKDAEPIGPGPGNPLGTRWMGISSPLIGIHGTPDSASIGYSASHGCVRMRVSEAEWLFDNVDIGTPIFIIRQ